MTADKALRQACKNYLFLEIIDDASTLGDLAVLDRREGLMTSINSLKSLDFLIDNGADKWLKSEFNGGKKCRANAKLVAAAPELLEALQSLYDYCGEPESLKYQDEWQEAIKKTEELLNRFTSASDDPTR